MDGTTVSEPLTKSEMIADWKDAHARIDAAELAFKQRAAVKLAAKKAEMFPVNSQVINGGELHTADIFRAVCQVMAVGPKDLLGPYKWRRFADARFVAFYFMRRHARLSFPLIGRLVGHRNHSTVINGLWVIDTNPDKFEPWLSAVAARLGVTVKP